MTCCMTAKPSGDGARSPTGKGGALVPSKTCRHASVAAAVADRLYPPSRSTAKGATGCSMAVICPKHSSVTLHLPTYETKLQHTSTPVMHLASHAVPSECLQHTKLGNTDKLRLAVNAAVHVCHVFWSAWPQAIYSWPWNPSQLVSSQQKTYTKLLCTLK